MLPALPSLLALRIVFGLNAMGLALWFPRIPEVKAALDVSLLVLSFCFFMLPVGTMIGFSYASATARRFGARTVCIWGGPVFILAFILPALAGSAVTLGLALLVAGMTIAPIEVAMNAKASQVEAASARRIMSGCHGFWSLGAMAGALVGGALSSAGMSFLAQQLILAPALALLAWYVAQPLIPDAGARATDAAHGFALPPLAALGLCSLPMGALMIEGAMMEWSALYLRDDRGFGSFTAALTFAGFAAAMAIGRMAGDRITERFGALPVMTVSATLAGLGIAGFALSQAPMTALILAVITGFGVANIYPLVMSAAGKMPGGTAERDIAAVAFTAFSAFLIGPPLIGSLGSLIGLPGALLCLTPIGLYPVLTARAALDPAKQEA